MASLISRWAEPPVLKVYKVMFVYGAMVTLFCVECFLIFTAQVSSIFADEIVTSC